MNWLEYPLVVLALALGGAIGFFAGALLVIKAFVDMHNLSLPPARRSTSIFSKQNLTPGAARALMYVAVTVMQASLLTVSVAIGRGLP